MNIIKYNSSSEQNKREDLDNSNGLTIAQTSQASNTIVQDILWKKGLGQGALVPSESDNLAEGKDSAAIGTSNNTINQGEFAIGQFNAPAADYTMFTIGNGTDDGHRSNAFKVNADGDTYVAGDLDIGINATFGGDIHADGGVDADGDIHSDTNLTAPTITGSQGNFANLSVTVEAVIKALEAEDITCDNLTVTKAAHFFKLIIDEVKATKGQIIITPANAKIDKVSLNPSYYRCYFRASDADGKEITNSFDVNDQVLCQTFNVASGTSYNASNRYYWRLCTGVSSTPVTVVINGDPVECHYIDLSMSDKDQYTNNAPKAGDEVVMLGNRNNTARQAAIIISAYNNSYIDNEIESPSIVQYYGINDYNLKNHRYNVISKGLNSFRGEFKTTAGEEIGNIEVGGRNLVMNGAFIKDTTYWSNWGSPTTREIYTDTYTKKWMHCVTTTSQFEGYSQSHYNDYHITIEENEEYTVSFKAYSPTTAKICAGFHWFEGTNFYIASQNWVNFDIDSTPKTYFATLEIPANITHFNIMVGDRTTTSQEFYITDVKFEKGNRATDWTPSLEEQDATISGMQTNISTNTTNISNLQVTTSGIQSTVSSQTTTISDLSNRVTGCTISISQLQQTASGLQSSVSTLEGYNHRNYFSFNRGIKPNSNTCMLYPYEYGFVGWGNNDAIINFGFDANDQGSTWTCCFQMKASGTVNVSPTFCNQTPIKIFKNGSEYSSSTTIAKVGSSWNTYVITWGAITSSDLISTSLNGILKFTKNDTSKIITLRNICLTKGQIKDLAFEIAPEDKEYQGAASPFNFNYNNMIQDGEYRGLNVYTSNLNPTSSSQNINLIVYNGFTIKDKTPYTLSFWAKSDMTNTFLRHYCYNGAWNLHAGSEFGATENNGADGSWKTDLSTNWKHYTVHWVSHVESITGSDATQKLIKNIIGLRLQYAANSNNQSAHVSIAGMIFQEGWIEDSAATSSSLIEQTANNILLQVGNCGIDITNEKISLNGDTNINGTLTLDEAGQGFILAGNGGKTQITPDSIGTYNNFINNASPNVLVNNLINSLVEPWASSQTTTTASWSFSNSFGTIPSGVTIPLSGQSISFRNYNSSNILTPYSITNTYKVYINNTQITSFTNNATSGTVGSFTTTSSGTLRVDVTSSVIFNTSSLVNNTVIGNYNYYIKLPKDMFTMIGYDGIASNFGNNSSVYFGPQAAYLRYGNYGINISDAGIKKLVGNNWMPLNYLNVVRTSASTYNLDDADKRKIDMVVTTSSSPQTIILPLPSSCAGRRIYIKCNGTGSPKVYCGATSTTTAYFVGPTSNRNDIVNFTDYGSPLRVFISDGTYWQVGYQG